MTLVEVVIWAIGDDGPRLARFVVASPNENPVALARSIMVRIRAVYDIEPVLDHE
jgi:hypothetical protein